MLLAKGRIEHPGKESSNSYNTWLSSMRTQGDRDQEGAGEQRSQISPGCAQSQWGTGLCGRMGITAGRGR